MGRLKRKNSNVVLNNQTRLFIKVKDKNSCCSRYEYHSCASIGDISKARTSERTRLYAPSATEYNKFDIIADITSSEISGSSSISTNYKLGNSRLEQLFDENCLFDAQIHIGKCTNPSIFHEFEKIIILEGIDITSYNIANILAATQADVGVITESIDFTYESMYSFFPPLPKIDVSEPLDSGPIIDSFTNCDQNCCLCPENVGTFLIQLEVCSGFDCNCELPDCILPRILYRTNCNADWQVYQIANVGDIDCDNPLNRNVMHSTTSAEYYYVYLSNTLGASMTPLFGTINTSILENSLITIPDSALTSGTLYSADGSGTNVILVGNANIVRYDTVTQTYYLIPNPDNHQCVDVDFASDEIAYIATTSDIVLRLDLTDNSLTEIRVVVDLVHHLEAISENSFVAAVGDSLYLVCGETVTKSNNITGTVTALASANENILYAATFDAGVNKSWVSVDGGYSFTLLSNDDHITTNISACVEKPNSVTFAGLFNPNGTTELELQTAALVLPCGDFPDVTGFILEDNKC